MEIQGQIYYVAQAVTGQKQDGSTWMKQDFVVVVHGERFDRKVALTLFDESKIRLAGLQTGKWVKVAFDIDAHEYQGRWFNSLNAWKVIDLSNMGAQQPAQQPMMSAQQQTYQATGQNNDGLPF